MTPAAFAAFATVAIASCINPHDRYDEYLVNTADARGGAASVVDAAPVEAQAIDGGFHDTYFAACLAVLAGGRANKALRFRVDVKFTPSSPTTTAGTLGMSFVSINKNGTTMADVVGGPFGDRTATVADDGKFSLDLGQPVIPADGNPISTNDIVFASAVLNGILLGSDLFCADLFGEITSPLPVSFNGGNYCLFQRLAADATLPSPTADQFHCP